MLQITNLYSLHTHHSYGSVRYAFVIATTHGCLDIAHWLCSQYDISADIFNFCLKWIRENDTAVLQFLFEHGATLATLATLRTEHRVELLTRFGQWKNKVETHQILLLYCDKEDWCYLDNDTIRNILTNVKSVKKFEK